MNIDELLNSSRTIINPNYNPKSKKNRQPKTIDVINTQSSKTRAQDLLDYDYRHQTIADEKTAKKYYNAGLDYNTWENLDKQLADNQSNWTKMGNSFAQTIVSEIGLGTLKGFADLYDVIANQIFGSNDDAYNENPLSKAFGEWQEKFEQEVAPIYVDPDVDIQNGGLTNIGWWASNMPSIASTLTLLIPGEGMAKAVSMAGKAAKVGKGASKARRWLSRIDKIEDAGKLKKWQTAINNPINIKRANTAVNTAISATTMRAIENYQEAKDTHLQTYEAANEKFANMSDDDFSSWVQTNKGMLDDDIDLTNRDAVARNVAKKAADRTFAMDFSNLIFDVIQLHSLKNIGKGVKKATGRGVYNAQQKAVLEAEAYSKGLTGEKATEYVDKALKKPIHKKAGNAVMDFIKHNGKEVLAESTEGIEEAVNYIASQEGLTYGKAILEGKADDFNNGIFTGTISSWANLQGRLGDYLKTAELQESAFWGVAGGVLFQHAGSALRKGQLALTRKAAEKRRNKINEITGEKVNTNTWSNLLELPENKAARIAIEKRQTILEQAAKDIEQIKAGKDIFSTPNPDGTFKNFEGDVEARQKIAIARVQSDLISQMAIDAVNSGTYDMLVDYFKAQGVKDAMVAAGLSTKEEIDGYVENTIRQLEETKDLYAKHSAHVMNQLAYINGSRKESETIPIEYGQIIATQNVYKAIEAAALGKQASVAEALVEEQIRLDREISGNSEDFYVRAKESIKLGVLVSQYGMLSAKERDLQAIKADDSFPIFEKERQLSDIRNQKSIIIDEIKKSTRAGSVATASALFVANKYGQAYRKVDAGHSIDTEVFERADEEILKETKELFGVETNLSDDVVIQTANSMIADMDTHFGKNGIANENSKLFTDYAEYVSLVTKQNAVKSTIAHTKTQVKEAVDFIHNSHNEARKKLLEKAEKIIRTAYDQYSGVTDEQGQHIEEAIVAAYRGDKQQARAIAEQYMSTDGSNGFVTASEFMDALDVFNLSSATNEAMFDYIAKTIKATKEQKTKARKKTKVENTTNQNQNSGTLDSEVNTSSQNQLRANTGQQTQPQSQVNSQNDNRQIQWIKPIINNTGTIITIKNSTKQAKGAIPVFVNDDGSYELDAQNTPKYVLTKLINSGAFNVADDVDLLGNAPWVVTKNPIYINTKKGLVLSEQGQIENETTNAGNTDTQAQTATSQVASISQTASTQSDASSPVEKSTTTSNSNSNQIADTSSNDNADQENKDKIEEAKNRADNLTKKTTTNDKPKFKIGDKVSTNTSTVYIIKDIRTSASGKIEYLASEENANTNGINIDLWYPEENLQEISDNPSTGELDNDSVDTNNLKVGDTVEFYNVVIKQNGTGIINKISQGKSSLIYSITDSNGNNVTVLEDNVKPIISNTDSSNIQIDDNNKQNNTNKAPATPVATPSDIVDNSEELQQLGIAMFNAFSKHGNIAVNPDLDIDAIAETIKAEVKAIATSLGISEAQFNEEFNSKINSLKDAAEKLKKLKSPLANAGAGLAMAAKFEELNNGSFSSIFTSTINTFMEEYRKVIAIPRVDGKDVVRLEDVLRICNAIVPCGDATAAKALYNVIRTYLVSEEGQLRYIVTDLNKGDSVLRDINKTNRKLNQERDLEIEGQYNVNLTDFIQTADNLNDTKYFDVLKSLKVGDKVKLIPTDDGYVVHVGNKDIGIIPSVKIVGDSYVKINNGFVDRIKLDAKGNPISPTMDIIMDIFTSDRVEAKELQALFEQARSLLTAHSEFRLINPNNENYDLADKLLEEFENNVIIRRLVNDAKSTDSDNRNLFINKNTGTVDYSRLFKHLSSLWRYTTEASTALTKDQVKTNIKNNLIRWYKKLYSEYDAISGIEKPIDVEITHISEGSIIRATDDTVQEYDKMPLAKEALGTVGECKIAIVNPKDTTSIVVSGKEPIFNANLHSGSTIMAIFSRNLEPDYIKAFGVKLEDANCSNEHKAITNAAKMSLELAFTKVMREGMAQSNNGRFLRQISLDNIEDIIKSIISINNSGYNALFRPISGHFKITDLTLNGSDVRGINIEYLQNGKTVKSFKIFNKNNFNATALNIITTDNKGNKVSLNLKGETFNTFAKDASSLFLDFISDVANVNIDTNLIQSDNVDDADGLKGFFSKKDGKLSLNIPTNDDSSFTLEYDSYNDYLIQNNLIRVNTKKNKNGSNFDYRGSDQRKNQILSVSLPKKQKAPILKYAVDANDHVEKESNTKEYEEYKELIDTNKQSVGLAIVEKALGKDFTDRFVQLAETYGEEHNLLEDVLPKSLIYDGAMNRYKPDGTVDGAIAETKADDKRRRYHTYENGERKTKDIGAVAKKGEKTVVGSKFLNMLSSPLLRRRKNAIRVLMHEKLHELLGKDSTKRLELLKSIQENLDIFLNEIDSRLANTPKDNPAYNVYKNIKATLTQYKTINKDSGLNETRLEEFIVESLTNKNFFDVLNSIEVENADNGKKENLFTRIARFIAELFGWKINDNSLYMKQLSVLRDVFSEDSSTIEENKTNTTQTEFKTDDNSNLDTEIYDDSGIEDSMQEDDSIEDIELYDDNSTESIVKGFEDAFNLDNTNEFEESSDESTDDNDDNDFDEDWFGTDALSASTEEVSGIIDGYIEVGNVDSFKQSLNLDNQAAFDALTASAAIELKCR